MTTSAATRWQDWASFGLGLWLAMSPWIVGYSGHEVATANAAFTGLALALGSHFEVSFDEISIEWFNLAAGLWLVAAPFVLNFTALAEVTANTIAVGALVAALSASALSLDKDIGRWWQNRTARP